VSRVGSGSIGVKVGALALRRGRARLSIRRFDPGGPYFRYALLSLLIVWFIAFSATRILPNEYISRATLIVPGASTSVSVSLDSIGQTNTAPTSAYNTMSLSPKVIYREMAQSETVRSAAARSLGMTLEAFGAPRIKLVDETALIQIEFRAPTPEGAQARASALVAALQAQLDALRRDELERRSAAVRENMRAYEEAVAVARGKIAAMQAESGLVSVGQFHELSTSYVHRQRRLGELVAEADRIEGEQKVLGERLAISPALAASALKLVGDPVLAKLVTDYAELNVQLDVERRRLGAESPVLMQIERRWTSLTQQIEAAMTAARVAVTPDMQTLVLIANNSHQADLFKRLVGNESTLEGKRREVAAVRGEVEALRLHLQQASFASARLEDLKKEHLVAEAVLTSAMARLNTAKSDLFGSYPLVQTLAQPTLPTRLGSNGPMLAFAGGIAGTLLISFAWFLTWLRAEFVRKRLKSA
jgi:uncharacterized protein involved in exopolysaccharide biosynthesis